MFIGSNWTTSIIRNTPIPNNQIRDPFDPVYSNMPTPANNAPKGIDKDHNRNKAPSVAHMVSLIWARVRSLSAAVIHQLLN